MTDALTAVLQDRPQQSERPHQNAGLNDLRWLARYAEHCGFYTGQTTSMMHALRTAFGPAAWRIVCRSPKACFIPILRNRELTIHSLIAYCRRLAERSFVQAPKPILLAYYVRQRRLYFDRPVRIPQEEDYDLIRLANRESHLRLSDIALVSNWAHQSNTAILPNHRWSTLVARAHKHNAQQRVYLYSARREPWHFFCRATPWRGYQVEPIADALELWQEGQRHGNCLYNLRHICMAVEPSRFFRVSKGSKPVATLELAWRVPVEDFTGMDRLWGRWELQDLRLSYNRLPHEHLVIAMQAFAAMYNIWAKRLRRMPEDYVEDTLKRIARAKRLSVWGMFMTDEQTPA